MCDIRWDCLKMVGLMLFSIVVLAEVTAVASAAKGDYTSSNLESGISSISRKWYQ